MAQRARDCGRAPGEVTLVAVSKTFAADEVWPTIRDGGQTVFGENRVQEAMAKWADLRARAAALGKTIELHLIGPLQSNKAREAVETFDVIETVDREKIAAALAAAMAKTGRRPKLFVEVNTGAEPQKAGVLPQDADAFLRACRETHGLAIEGLMAMPPADELASPHFALLGEIARRNGLADTVDGHERRLAAGRATRRDAHPRRLRDFRLTAEAGLATAAPLPLGSPPVRTREERDAGSCVHWRQRHRAGESVLRRRARAARRDAAIRRGRLRRLRRGDVFLAQRSRGAGARRPESGLHFCFAAPTRASVDAFHAAALGAGGRDNGAPGLRPDYGPNYYAAFVVDPDGYRIEAYCGAAA